jgi:HPt (histidine-containing phosphotransfer) domain-containing protein
MDAGMNAHVGKPFDLNYLVDVLLTQRRAAAPHTPLPKPTVPTRTAADTSELDVAGALERIGDDADLYRALLDAFVKEITPMADQLDALVNAADWAGVNRMMHSLKGNSSTVGAAAMESVAREAEQASEGEATGFVAGNFSFQVREALQLTLAAAQRASAKLP